MAVKRGLLLAAVDMAMEMCCQAGGCGLAAEIVSSTQLASPTTTTSESIEKIKKKTKSDPINCAH